MRELRHVDGRQVAMRVTFPEGPCPRGPAAVVALVMVNYVAPMERVRTLLGQPALGFMVSSVAERRRNEVLPSFRDESFVSSTAKESSAAIRRDMSECYC